jgi:pilus assembly protein Flp/PilA
MNYTTSKIAAKLQSLWATREQGATAVEYALMIALIAIAVIGAVTWLGSKMNSSFNNTANSIK